ncbi:SRPBCC domain-containing protein [Lacinutrix neustonica]|uniref:SRPBCC domain-containing protein n=1 Tax=Lacinutrix neustonica TaxID=2980107 RepID=A0A9E8MWZ4_9FLAO|nr:SRPBCC domain-containing protein [Lacinutrix neustonica]WAC03006.1 SRPBCC domain-containing protein [Lacinutrix neustonica]WAC03083.1 SRPBCC domain-containing protein [Lacinutrix neustonica]
MKKVLYTLLFLYFPFVLVAQTTGNTENRITSVIDSSKVDNMVLKQSFIVNVALDSVWNAYTTKKGWESWATAIAEIDFKNNGIIKTNYNKAGKIGDESTITLHILNYIPKRMLTLQAELTKNFPEFMKADEKDLYNVILFEEVSSTKTKVTSYGIGYKNNEKYMSLMKFFIQGNEQSYLNLMSYLETGEPSAKY